MDFFTYSLTSLIAFLGLFIGLLLANFSEDEVHAFKKYIPFMQLMMIVLVFANIFMHFPIIIAGFMLILSFAFIYLFWHRRDINLLDYMVFSVLFVITSVNVQAHYLMTAIIFTFGILSGALFFSLHREDGKKKKKHIGHHKHSGKHIEFNIISNMLCKKYLFFFILTLVNFIVAEVIAHFI